MTRPGLASRSSASRRRPAIRRLRSHSGGSRFRERSDTLVFSTRQVVEEGRPVLLVVHDEDGGWQFLCATTADVRDGVEVTLGSILGLQPEIGELASLPRGWTAERAVPGLPWLRQPIWDEAA